MTDLPNFDGHLMFWKLKLQIFFTPFTTAQPTQEFSTKNIREYFERWILFFRSFSLQTSFCSFIKVCWSVWGQNKWKLWEHSSEAQRTLHHSWERVIGGLEVGEGRERLWHLNVMWSSAKFVQLCSWTNVFHELLNNLKCRRHLLPLSCLAIREGLGARSLVQNIWWVCLN